MHHFTSIFLYRKAWVYMLVLGSMIAMGKDCKTTMLDAVAQHSQVKDLSLGEIWSYHMDIKVKPATRTGQPFQTSKMAVLMNKDIFISENDQVKIIGDSNMTISVLKSSKIVILSEGSVFENKDFMMPTSMATLFEHIENYICSNITVSGKTLKKILCVPNTSFKEENSMDKIEYVLDTAQRNIIKSKIFFLPAADTEYIEVSYKNSSKTQVPLEYQRGIYLSVYESADQKKLKQKYAGYRVVDQRKK